MYSTSWVIAAVLGLVNGPDPINLDLTGVTSAADFTNPALLEFYWLADDMTGPDVWAYIGAFLTAVVMGAVVGVFETY